MNKGMTDKFRIARIISATAVLLDNWTPADDASVNKIVLGRAAYLIQGLWQARFPKLKGRREINEFWRRIQVQAVRNPDIVTFFVVCNETVNPAGYAYGTNVRLELKTARGPAYHAMSITAKKD